MSRLRIAHSFQPQSSRKSLLFYINNRDCRLTPTVILIKDIPIFYLAFFKFTVIIAAVIWTGADTSIRGFPRAVMARGKNVRHSRLPYY